MLQSSDHWAEAHWQLLVRSIVMADNEKDKDVTPSRGADWEVVQLTASTYAAAPNPQENFPDDVRTGQESSSALFMSRHFVFPPKEHENLPLEPDCSEMVGEAEGADESYAEEEDVGGDTINEKLVKSYDNPQGAESFEVGSASSVPTVEFEDVSSLQGVHSVRHPLSTDILDTDDSSSPHDDSLSKHSKSSEDDGSGIPSEGWWKRHASSLYRHAKETNTFWSIFVAAALTGLVILGKRWQRVNDEKASRMLGPINRVKDIIKCGRQQS